MFHLKLFVLVSLCSRLALPVHAGVITNFQYLSAVESHEKGKFPEAARKFEKLLTSTDPAVSGHAAFQLFEYYFNGQPGIPQSHQKALQYLELAYKSRNATWSGFAANRKGIHSQFGVAGLVEVDRVAALKFFEEGKSKNTTNSWDRAISDLMGYPDVYVSAHPEIFGTPSAADSNREVAPGSVETAIELAKRGEVEKALEIYRWHGRRGDSLARYGLVLALQNIDAQPEKSEMLGWLYLTAKNGMPEAQMWYGAFLLEETKAYTSEGLSWIERASAQGNAAAENLLALYSLNGIREVAPNKSSAIRRFQRAVTLGSPQAMVNLGDLYFDGTSIGKDVQTAESLYRQAAVLGDPVAAERLSARFGISLAKPQAAPDISQASASSVARNPPISQAEILIDKRVALVIGNAAYERMPLRNPVNDSRLIASELKKANFRVFQVENGSLEDIYRTIDRFSEAILADGVALVYYAGHGVQISGENFLIPVGAALSSETDAKYKTINLGFILSKLEDAKSRVNVVILDACRDNPFARSWRSQRGGLAAIDAPAGTMIAFSTAPGQVASDGDGDNGLFTAELVKELRKPNQKIEDILKNTRRAVSTITGNQQIPWDSSSLMGNFYFQVRN